jgi:hypothetical protein
MNHNDPPRLSSLPSNEELREVMRVGQQRVPDAAALERLRARLDGALNAPGTPAPPHTAFGVKVVAATIITCVIVAGVVHFATSRPAAPTPAPHAPLGEFSADSELPRIPTPVERPSAPVSTPTSALPAVLVRKERAAPSTAPLVTAQSPSPVVSAPSELDLIGAAIRVLKTDSGRALALANEHQKLYPTGSLTEEREVIAIEALARLGNGELARARADRFSLTFPRSAHLARVARAIPESGAQKNEPPLTPPEK